MTHPKLSAREVESLHWISRGKTSWEIAVILGISEHTVNFHVRNLCAKLQAPNRLAAITIALSRGILKPISDDAF